MTVTWLQCSAERLRNTLGSEVFDLLVWLPCSTHRIVSRLRSETKRGRRWGRLQKHPEQQKHKTVALLQMELNRNQCYWSVSTWASFSEEDGDMVGFMFLQWGRLIRRGRDNKNIERNTDKSAPQLQAEGRGGEGWVLQSEPELRVTIFMPPDWNVFENNRCDSNRKCSMKVKSRSVIYDDKCLDPGWPLGE